MLCMAVVTAVLLDIVAKGTSWPACSDIGGVFCPQPIKLHTSRVGLLPLYFENVCDPHRLA